MLMIISCVMIAFILIFLKIILGVNIKKIKELSQKSPLDELVKRLPDNITIGKEMLAMLKNESVTIEKSSDEKTGTSLYLVMSNKIIIAEGKESYAGVQTMAHECLHSVQSKKLLWFNFIYSNLYIIYTLASIILTILGIIKNIEFQLYILALLGLVFYAVRSYLETDAMTKARYLAKEYLNQKGMHTEEEIDALISAYDQINHVGIPTVNYTLLLNVLSKLLIYSIIAIMFPF